MADLFSASLISPEVASALPETYTIRPLRASDYNNGFLDVLRVLTTVGDISQEAFGKRFEEMRREGSGYHVLVILDGKEGEGKVVGTGCLVVERKL